MRLGNVERISVTVLLAVVALFMGFDIYSDSGNDATAGHIFVECVAALLAVVGICLLWLKTLSLRTEVHQHRESLRAAEANAQRWKSENAKFIGGLSAAIDREFVSWSLTETEKEVALLLLKGLSLKEVADVRGKSERTVRQQALAVYSKSGLGGRAELSAYFLEDLLAPVIESPASVK